MKIMHISDSHNRHKYIKWPVSPNEIDVLIHSGDMSGMGNHSEVHDFLKWFSLIPCKYKILIAGNHDKSFDEKFSSSFLQPEWLIEEVNNYTSSTEFGRNFYLRDKQVEIEGVQFYGSPWTPWFHGDFWAFNAHRGEEINKIWRRIPHDTQVLITHGPTYGCLDQCINERGSVGCEELLKHIKEFKPLIHLFGHIHEAYGSSYDENTHYFNSSICNLDYEPVNPPQVFEADFIERKVKLLYNTN